MGKFVLAFDKCENCDMFGVKGKDARLEIACATVAGRMSFQFRN